LSIGARDSGTAGSLEACIFEIIALNQKNLLNLLTNFLRSFRIHKGPTSDIGTLTIRLRARDFYEVIVDEGEARINYHLIEIQSE
jgi:hypothetical protein